MTNVQATERPTRPDPWRALLGARNPDGGWGAGAGAVSNTECTALACLALEHNGDADASAALDAGRRWLIAAQDDSGAWPYSAQTPTAPWPTPIVLLALAGFDEARQAREAGFRWLLEVRSRNFGLMARIRSLLFRDDEAVELDEWLEGWPWVPDTFSWVEPTAWALMALEAEWPDERPRHVRSRIDEAEAMLLDRECPGGGWNYGNTVVMNQELSPYPDTTALALMALRGRDTPAVARGLAALDKLLGQHASILSLSLAVLAKRAWRRDTTDLLHRLDARLATPDPPDHRSLALAALAFTPRIAWLEDPTHA